MYTKLGADYEYFSTTLKIRSNYNPDVYSVLALLSPTTVITITEPHLLFNS